MIDLNTPEINAVIDHEMRRIVRHVFVEAQRRAAAVLLRGIPLPADLGAFDAAPLTPALPATVHPQPTPPTAVPVVRSQPTPRPAALHAPAARTGVAASVPNDRATDARFVAWAPKVLAFCRGKAEVEVADLLAVVGAKTGRAGAKIVMGYVIASIGGHQVRRRSEHAGERTVYRLPPTGQWATDLAQIVLTDVRLVGDMVSHEPVSPAAQTPVAMEARSRVLRTWTRRYGDKFIPALSVEHLLARDAGFQHLRAKNAREGYFGVRGLLRGVLAAQFGTRVDGFEIEGATHPVSLHVVYRAVKA